MTWKESILQAFNQCNGVGTPTEIIELTKKIRIQNGYKWKEGEGSGHGSQYNVWSYVEQHCKGYKQCKGDPLFVKEDAENGIVWRLLSKGDDKLLEQFKQEYLSGKYAAFEKDVKDEYNNFNSKYALKVLAGLKGKDLLNTLHNLNDKDNLWYVLEKNKDYKRLFGAARIGNMNRFLLYCSSGNWVKAADASAFNKTSVSESEAVKFAKNYIIKNLQVASNVINKTVKGKNIKNIDYLDMERRLKIKLKDFPIDYQWVRKYLHLIYPDYFPTFYSEDIINKVVKRISGTVDDDLWVNMGEIVKFAKKCKIPNAVFANIAANMFNLDDDENTKDDNMNIGSKKEREDIPLNQIFYGAPGTGKTYKTIIKALEIITGKTYDLSDNLQEREKQYTEYLGEFNKFKAQGQIEFVTFHPSTSYEEFVEGIKPVMQESDTEQNLQYRIESGIFKRMAERAGEDTYSSHGERIDFTKTRIFKMSLGQGTDNDIFKYCMENNVIANGYGNGIDFTGVKTKQDIIKKVGSDKKYDFSVEAMNRFILWMRPGDVVLIADGISSVAAIAQVEGDYEYKTDTEINYTNFRKVKWLYKGDIPIKTIYNKNLSMQSIYAFYDKNKEGTPEYNTNIITESLNKLISGKELPNKDKKYVLIIDEINRGNISKIFGELITLLESTKRIGADEEVRVTLPYSKESFGVPNNLYIIGTMNTSDRSIASLDIALRRRFSFIAMRPEDNLVKDVANIELNSVFTKMNKKIEILLDEDHMIGHSFLMKCKSVEDVREAWFNKIMPLINEYFYGDWEKIKMVLGDGFVKSIPINDMPEDIKRYCNGEAFYMFEKIQDNLKDEDFVNKLNKLA